jgi:hypothetical protein
MSMPAIIFSSSALMCGEPPGLVEPKFSLPGLARASLSSSPKFFAGRSGCTVITFGVLPITVTGGEVLDRIVRRSRDRRNDAVRADRAEHERVAVGRGLGDRLRADGAARSGPVLDEKRLAMLSVRRAALSRARMSLVPPGGYGTMMRTALFGYCASAEVASSANRALRQRQ